MEKRKIGIIGGGNLGSVLAVKFSINNVVTLYTNLIDRVSQYQKDMSVYCEDTDSYYEGRIAKITCSLKELVDNSEYIFITFPAFLFEQLANELVPLLNAGQHLVFIPGSGGAELFFKDALKKGVTISGLQRVHSVARIVEFGKLVKESGVRRSLRVASIPSSYNHKAAKDISSFYGLAVEELDNYLNITLINSNPILHTSRLYSIFHDYPSKVDGFDSLPLFYEDWDLNTANLLVAMDNELFSIIDKLNSIGLPVKQITRIVNHYDSEDAKGLTNKLRSIQSLKGLTTPSINNNEGKLIPDFSSRYFTADFPYGLDILRSFAKFLNIDVPNMDLVSDWYRKASNNLVSNFSLQKFGINTYDDLIELYK